MKKKVEVNREKISSEEIASRKNFESLIKTYPHLSNPYRGKTSWRKKSMLWAVVVIAALFCYYMLEQKGCNLP